MSSCWRCAGTLRYGLSNRELEELLAERGIDLGVPAGHRMRRSPATVLLLKSAPNLWHGRCAIIGIAGKAQNPCSRSALKTRSTG